MKKETAISQIQLERYILGELPPDESNHVERCIHNNPKLQKKVGMLQRSNNEILNTYPLDQMTQEILLKSHTKKVHEHLPLKKPIDKNPIYILRPAVGFTIIVLLFLVFSPRWFNKQKNIPEIILVKGLSPFLVIYRQGETAPERLQNLSYVHAGDVLQLGYVPAGYKYGVIFSCDGNKTITVHYPESENRTLLSENQGEVLLKNSYILDNAPLFEHFFFIASHEPITVSEVLNAGKKYLSGGDIGKKNSLLDLPSSFKQFSLVLQKEEL